MLKRKLFFFLLFINFCLSGFSQKIVYSEPDRTDSRRMDFELIGKIAGNFLIYKDIGNKVSVTAYDNDMKEVGKGSHEYLPDERMINVDFFPYSDFAYMIYQYQKKNIVYCKAVKINGNGEKASEIITLDTAHIGFATNNKIYSAITSEDKNKLMVFKINSRNRSSYLVTTQLFDNNLTPEKRSNFRIAMDDSRDDYLNEFSLDNDGDLVFTKFSRGANDAITRAELVWKAAQADSISFIPIPAFAEAKMASSGAKSKSVCNCCATRSG